MLSNDDAKKSGDKRCLDSVAVSVLNIKSIRV
jgi:hypothetical protein